MTLDSAARDLSSQTEDPIKVHKSNLREQIHTLLDADANPEKLSRHYRLEWFQELTDPKWPVGVVKFDLIVSHDPKSKRKFSVRIGYSIVKPALVQDARGYYQDFRLRERTGELLVFAMVVPLNLLAAVRTPVETIEQAIARTVAVGHQPYKQVDYNMSALEQNLTQLYQDGVSCIASGAFSNPLHPQLTYELVAQKQGDTVTIHYVGRSGIEIADIRTFPQFRVNQKPHQQTIGEIVDAFHDSLRDSYISPEQLAAAISRFQPKEAGYFK